MSEFGSAFGPVTPPPPTHDEREHLELLSALGDIREALLHMHGALAILAAREPAAAVEVAPTDLAPLLAALDRPLPVPPSPEAVAEALARRLPDYGPTLVNVAEAMESVGRNLERMNKKITAMSVMPSGGSSGHVIVDSGQVTIAGGSEFPWTSGDRATMSDIRRGISDTRILMDYAGRTDSLPVYVGKAVQGTASSNNSWNIQRLSYDVDNRLIDRQILTGAWDNRATLGWV